MLESCRLAELKYAIFSRTGHKNKKLRRSNLLLSTVFKHGLLEGSTFLFQYTSITLRPLESSRLGELKYAISAGFDVRPNNKSIRKCKKMTARRENMVTLLWTGGNSASSRFSWRKVWNGVKFNFSSVHHQERKVYGKLSISRVQMCNFTRMRHKTKKLWLSRVQKFTFSIYDPERILYGQPGLGPTQKGVLHIHIHAHDIIGCNHGYTVS